MENKHNIGDKVFYLPPNFIDGILKCCELNTDTSQKILKGEIESIKKGGNQIEYVLKKESFKQNEICIYDENIIINLSKTKDLREFYDTTLAFVNKLKEKKLNSIKRAVEKLENINFEISKNQRGDFFLFDKNKNL